MFRTDYWECNKVFNANRMTWYLTAWLRFLTQSGFILYVNYLKDNKSNFLHLASENWWDVRKWSSALSVAWSSQFFLNFLLGKLLFLWTDEITSVDKINVSNISAHYFLCYMDVYKMKYFHGLLYISIQCVFASIQSMSCLFFNRWHLYQCSCILSPQ